MNLEALDKKQILVNTTFLIPEVYNTNYTSMTIDLEQFLSKTNLVDCPCL